MSKCIHDKNLLFSKVQQLSVVIHRIFLVFGTMAKRVYFYNKNSETQISEKEACALTTKAL